MFFSIDAASDVPIYEQIVRQVKLAVADGTLVGGQMLPSVRQLSRDIALNPNTIARAYRELQTQEILKPLRGRGMVVRRDAIEACTSARDDLVGEGVRRALADAIAGGMSPDQLRELFETELARLSRSAAEANSSSTDHEIVASSSNNESSHE
ncbi:GntR family transcriptional regulator [Rhodopirellula sp. JC740]|uniref:GntR family transcriptional regulator n=1 Tax=Rhodopirellula halodulae TaxID=2894198 RepID=A0ABS8NNW4_9BACT|nr:MULTISPECIES: GntR family transcriptional regulator [unclassified Rhodopirellula]MCC9644126.1 GntR family transcriptional regulator [Rhodopirellula sp. JC740]MCC9657286.1 GntR family transcriptional regulator [Rhodopirellula sp. JC737]